MSKKLAKTLLIAIVIAILNLNVAIATQTATHDTKKLIVKTAQKLGVDPYLHSVSQKLSQTLIQA